MGAFLLLGAGMPAKAAISSAAVRLQLSTPGSTVVAGIGTTLNVRPLNAQGQYSPLNGMPTWSVNPAGHGAHLMPTGIMAQFEPRTAGRYRVTVRWGKLTVAKTLTVVANTRPHNIALVGLTLVSPPAGSDLARLVPPLPKGMPPTTGASVRVPLYPAANATSGHPQRYPGPVPASWYLIASPAQDYYVSAPQERVMTWYIRAFSAAGFKSSGTFLNPQAHVLGRSFQSRTQPGANPLTVTVQTVPSGTGTLVTYAATWVKVPLRPALSLLHADKVHRIGITYRSAGKTLPPTHLVVTKPRVIRRLVMALNAMPLATTSVWGCPLLRPGQGIHATIAISGYPLIQLSNFCGDLGQMGDLRFTGDGSVLKIVGQLASVNPKLEKSLR